MAFLTKDNSVKQKKQRVKYTKGAKTFLEERDEKYHNQMLAQAGASFWLSFLGIVVGFIGEWKMAWSCCRWHYRNSIYFIF